MRKIILLITTFFYIYPIYTNFIPIPIDRVYQVLGFLCFMINPNDIKRMIKSKYINRYLIITLVLLLFAFIPQIWAIRSTDFWFVKEIINVFLQFFSAYFVYRIAVWALENVNIGSAIYYVVVAAILQVIISTVFFIKPEYYDVYSSFLNQDIRLKDYSEIRQMLNVRFMGVGSEVFGGVTKYGVAFFSILILPYVHKSFISKNKFVYWLAVLVIFAGGLLTGRTFFVAVLLGFIMFAFYRSSSIIDFIVENIKIILLFIILLVVLFFILSMIIDENQLQSMYNFVFEIFVNFTSGEGLQSRSTNRLMEMYVLPNSVKTWLIGDGRMMGFKTTYYMSTDVGYIRLLYYFGLPATLYFIYVLYRYCMILFKSHPMKIMKCFYFTIFWFFIVLNLKGFTFHTYYFALFLIFTVLPKDKMQVDSTFV